MLSFSLFLASRLLAAANRQLLRAGEDKNYMKRIRISIKNLVGSFFFSSNFPELPRGWHPFLFLMLHSLHALVIFSRDDKGSLHVWRAAPNFRVDLSPLCLFPLLLSAQPNYDSTWGINGPGSNNMYWLMFYG
jgi:hypothetical protein